MKKLIFSILILSSALLWADVPNRITYQGRLAKTGLAVTGAHIFVARILGADGKALWSSGNITVKLPASGDFSIVLEPTGVDWLNEKPQLEISIDGSKLSPNDGFSVSPYALVAAQAAFARENGFQIKK